MFIYYSFFFFFCCSGQCSSGGSIHDGSGNVWTMSPYSDSTGCQVMIFVFVFSFFVDCNWFTFLFSFPFLFFVQVVLNGAIDAVTSWVVEIAYVNARIYHEVYHFISFYFISFNSSSIEHT